MAKSILEEALEDTKLLKETAFENARNVLVEAISPQIKEFIDSQMSEVGAEGGESAVPAELKSIDPEMLKQLMDLLKSKAGAAPAPKEGMYEEDDVEDDSDEEDEEMEMDEAAEPVAEAGDKDKDDKEELSEAEEVVEITQEDLRRAFSEVVRSSLTEAEVTKGFGDVQNPTRKEAGGPDERGIAGDEKEEMWKDHEPPHSQDWTVKEAAYKKMVTDLNKQLSILKKENATLNAGLGELKRNLMEVNLFNSKLLYTNRLLQKTNLNNEQRLGVIEAFDRAGNLREVELVYKSLSESFKIAGVLSEANKQKVNKRGLSSRLTTSSSANMLREQAERETDASESFSERMQRLANLIE